MFKHLRSVYLPLHTLQAVCFVATLGVFATPSFAQNAIVVNGQKIPTELVDFILKEQAKRNPNANTPEARRIIVDELVKQEILKQEAIKKGLSSQSIVKYQTQMMNQAILANALRESFFKNNQPNEETLKANYDSIVKSLGSTEYRASHVLVQTEEEAKNIINKLNQGAKFADLAKAQSKDPGSAAQGGDLDWANPQSFVPEFSQAMVALKKGEYTKMPIKSQFGYHVILLSDTKPTNPPAFDQVKDQLGQKILNDRWEEYQAGLLGKAKIQ